MEEKTLLCQTIQTIQTIRRIFLKIIKAVKSRDSRLETRESNEKAKQKWIYLSRQAVGLKWTALRVWAVVQYTM